MTKFAYLTCELRARDLDAKLLLAAKLLERGFACVVGAQWPIWGNVHNLPKGTIVGTGGSLNHSKAFVLFKSRGSTVALIDEEALALVSPEHLIANITPEAAMSTDLFLAQSPAHATVTDGCPWLHRKILVTGNPRTDLVTDKGKAFYQPQADALRAQIGPFIVFNSNFALTHFLWGNIEQMSEAECAKRGLRMGMIAWERENKRLFIDLIIRCLNNLPHRIVIRPHPAERAGAWQSFCATTDRIVVAENTIPIPYLMAADVVVHTNCTTGLEAQMLGAPTINLSPDTNAEWHKAFITKDVNDTVQTVDQAWRFIDAVCNVGWLPGAATYDDKAESHLPSWTHGHSAHEAAYQISRIVPEVQYDPTTIKLEPIDTTPAIMQYRHKFTASPEEMVARFDRITKAFDLCSRVKVFSQPMGESVALFHVEGT